MFAGVLFPSSFVFFSCSHAPSGFCFVCDLLQQAWVISAHIILVLAYVQLVNALWHPGRPAIVLLVICDAAPLMCWHELRVWFAHEAPAGTVFSFVVLLAGSWPL